MTSVIRKAEEGARSLYSARPRPRRANGRVDVEHGLWYHHCTGSSFVMMSLDHKTCELCGASADNLRSKEVGDAEADA